MDLSIKLATLLLFAMSCTAAPTPKEEMLRALINPPQESNSGSSNTGTTTTITTNNNDNMIGDLVINSDQPIKSVKALKDALTASVKSQLMTSLANMTPEQVSTVTGAANSNQLSQLNLMGGINNLVSLIVQKILQALLPRIFGGASTPSNTGSGILGLPTTGGYNPQPAGGMFGSFGSSMNPMSMMIPGMMFGFMDKMIDFI